MLQGLKGPVPGGLLGASLFHGGDCVVGWPVGSLVNPTGNQPNLLLRKWLEFQRHPFLHVGCLESSQQFALIAFAWNEDRARVTATLGGSCIMQSQSPFGFTGTVTVEAALLQDRCNLANKIDRFSWLAGCRLSQEEYHQHHCQDRLPAVGNCGRHW